MVRSKSINPLHRKSLKRSSLNRKAKENILILTEGANTEVYYFNKILDLLGLSQVQVTVKVAKHPTPDKIFIEAASKNCDYDKVYCVFDKDKHESYDETICKIKNYHSKTKHIFCIDSVPCFEFWILIHYEYTTKHLYDCAEVTKILKKHIPDYGKDESSCKKIVNEIACKYEKAVCNAKKLQEANKNEGRSNPATNCHILIEHLIELSKEQK